MVDCKKHCKWLLRLTALCALLFSAAPASAYPLRVWVMPNEPADGRPELSVTQVQEYIDKLKKEDGIVIENSVRDLIQPSGVDNASPIGGYVIGDNKFVEELKEFKKEKSSSEPILVKFIRWSDAFNSLMSAREDLSIEQMPDIVQIGSTWVASFANLGALENLEDRIDETVFFPAATRSAHPQESNDLYAVPWFIDARLLFYRKDKIPESSLRDWKSFLSACPEILEENRGLKGVIGFSTAMTWNLLHNLSPWLWASGGDVLEEAAVGPLSAHSVRLDDPQSLEAVRYLRDLSLSGCAVVEDVNAETMENRFLKGEIAAMITIPAFRNRLSRELRDKTGVAPPPEGPEGSFPFVGGSDLAVWEGAEKRGNSKHALSLISYLTSPHSEKRYAGAIGFLPANREALASLTGEPYADTLAESLDKGKSYPSITEWGTVVENEFIRNHLWNIWQAIAQGQPDDVLVATVHDAADALRKNVALSVWRKNRWYALSAIALLMGAGGFLLYRSRRQLAHLERRLDKTGKELLDIEGEKATLQGQILLLERNEKRSADQINDLELRLAKLIKSSDSLSRQLSSMQARHSESARPLMGKINVAWDGRLQFDDKEVVFENANQAHRLIGHLIRQIANGVTSVNCLWGYPLFGWDSEKLHLPPNRLFNTAVAKINSAIVACKRPPLLKSEGRKSWRWRCLWDAKLLLENSDVGRAADLLSRSRQAAANSDSAGALRLLGEAIDTDPRCFDALNVLPSIPGNDDSETTRRRTLLAENVVSYADDLKKGSAELEMLKADDKLEQYRELIEQEAITMKQRANHLLKCIEGCSPGKPLHLNDIMCRLTAIQDEIMGLKSAGVVQKSVWATMVGHEKFVGLLSIPRVSTLVNRFYNRETKSIEDPRLVQLALILMIARPEYLEPLERAKTDDEFFAGFEKQLHKQFRALEQEISLSC